MTHRIFSKTFGSKVKNDMCKLEKKVINDETTKAQERIPTLAPGKSTFTLVASSILQVGVQVWNITKFIKVISQISKISPK